MSSAGEFRRRASFEARRYGGDAWVFVRELLQNSRDAGASKVEITVERRGGLDRIVCRDDGCGMSLNHARRFLFTLYASSKRQQRDAAGRFGIGFWSVLRFDPDRVIVRSKPRDRKGWELRLSGDLSTIEEGEPFHRIGTEIELVRSARNDDPAASVWSAVRRDARHLRRRDGDGEILDVWVNSRLATDEIELDPPSLEFSRTGFRGAVALVGEPLVDLLAHGLRVRTTATLDELLTRPDRRRRQSSALPKGLVPRVVLDSRRLQVLMARGDARTDRELRRLVRFGHRGIRRLVQAQLDRDAGLGVLGKAGMRGLELLSSARVRRFGAAVLVVAFLATVTWWLFSKGSGSGTAQTDGPVGAMARVMGHPSAILQRETSGRYRGPAVDPLQSQPARLLLHYQPRAVRPLFGVFRVSGMDGDGRVIKPAEDPRSRPYLGAECRVSCIDIALDLGGLSGEIRLPVPTGHLIDPATLRVDGRPADLVAAADGAPLLEVARNFSGRIGYRTGPAADLRIEEESSWPFVPGEAGEIALRAGELPTEEAVVVARDWVRRRVVYDTSTGTVERHRAATRNGSGFVERCLTIGAGDCDVQNGLLAAILAQAGFQVRLAVGFVGSGGRALPGLHAWVEVRSENGLWFPVDASRGAATGGPPNPSPPDAVVEVSDADTGAGSGSEPPLGLPAVAGRWLGLGVLFILVAVGAWLLSRRRLAVGRVRATEDPDLAGMLGGALARPEAYSQVPALFSRRLVPTLGGSATSLDRVHALARDGRLGVGSAPTELASRVMKNGLPVIDGGRPEGVAVARTLGAVDLDRWDEAIREGCRHPVTELLEQAGGWAGERWQVMIGNGLGRDVATLDGPLNSRVVLVDEGGALWRRTARLAETRPAAAALILAGRVDENLPMAPRRRQRLLARLAGAVLVETTERRS